MRRFLSLSILAFFAFLVPPQEIAFAEGGIVWDPKGKPICTASGNQQNIKMVADGFGGAIIVWQDYRNGPKSDIYAQRIDKNGYPRWLAGGVPVCTYTGDQKNPVIIGDDTGGAIIAWEDLRGGTSNSNIYAVRISSAGETYSPWPQNGLALRETTTANQLTPDIASVGCEGAVIVWQEDNGSQYSIYAHGIYGDGSNRWGGSVAVSTGTAPKECPKIINDGMEYVIVTWQDFRSTNYDIYAQRMDIGTGSTSWTPNGEAVSVVTASDQKNPEIVPDGQGGAIIVWTDCRNGNSDIYAQRIDSNGSRSLGWALNGIPVCKIEGDQTNPVIINSLLGKTTDGAIIAWQDKRDNSSNGDIYAVKVGLEGGYDFTKGAVPIATGNNIQIWPRLVSDGQGGGIGTWIENGLITSEYEIFATKRNQDGMPMWSSYPGVLVCKGTRINDSQIISDGSGGAIVAWVGNYDIFAQKVVDNAIVKSASICGRVVRLFTGQGITGVEVWALTKDGELVSSCTTSTVGDYGLTGLVAFSTYTVRAMWTVNGIESSVSMEAVAPSYRFDFTLEIDYFLGTIAGNVSGIEKKYMVTLSSLQSKRINGVELQKILSPGNGIAFVELEQKGKAIARVPVDTEGNYSIPNLLPGRFIARAYNGTIYSNPRVVNLKEGETLRVDFAFGIMPEETVYNYSNPAKNGSTTIRYYCGYADPEAEIKIYNIAGELVRKVKDTEIDKADAPIYKFLWDCKNTSGKEVASGIYIYTVEVKESTGNGNKKVTKRMAIIR